MLQQIGLRNYRCFKKLVVPLQPLTVLIGPNDSGKSAFLRALLRFGSGGNHVERPSDVWMYEEDSTVLIGGASADKYFVMDFPGRSNSAVPPLFDTQYLFTSNAPLIDRAALFQASPDRIARPSPGYPDHQGPQPLGQDGSGLPSLLDYLMRREKKRFSSIVEAMKDFVPGLNDIEVGSPDASQRNLEFNVEQGIRVPADQVSAGVRLLLFFVTMAYHPTPPKLLLIEEPETGVHPKRLADIMKLLREITEGKHGGHAAQVVLTTHSPYLLDLVDLDRDQVLVFSRNTDGSRTAEPVDRERLKVFLDEFMLGEVWYNQGEEGLVARHS